MLTHECLHARALTTLDRRNDEVMLPVRVPKHVVHSIQARLVESNRLGAYKGYAGVALQGLLDHRAARFAHDQVVKPCIHVGVQRLIALVDVPLGEDAVAVRQAQTQCVAKRPGGASFRHASGGQSLDYTAQMAGIEDVSRVALLPDTTRSPRLYGKN